MLILQELEIAEKEGRRLRREGESKKEKVKEEEEAGPSGAALDGDGPTPMETQMSGLDERSACPQALALSWFCDPDACTDAIPACHALAHTCNVALERVSRSNICFQCTSFKKVVM